MADAVRTVTYKLLVDGSEVQRAIADINSSLSSLNKTAAATQSSAASSRAGGSSGRGGGKSEYGFDAYDQKVANDTYRLRMKLWNDEQRKKQDSERDAARARAERERDARRQQMLGESVVERQLSTAQKGLSAFSGLARSLQLLSSSGGESMEDIVRAFANLEGMLQGAHGILDAIETIASLQKTWRMEAELTSAAMKATSAIGAAGSIASGAGEAAGAAGGGAGLLGGLGSSGVLWGLATAAPVMAIAATVMGLQKQKDFRAEERQIARSRYAARMEAGNYALDAGFDRAERAGADPLSLINARGTAYSMRLGQSVSQRVMQADFGDLSGVVSNRSRAEEKELMEERAKLTTAHYQNELDNLRKLADATNKRYDLEMQRIDEARQRATELVSTLQGAYEGAVHRRQGIEERIATGDPGAIALARRGMMKADAGEELSAREASAIRGFSPKYDAIAQEAFSRIARKKLPGALSDVDSEIEFFRSARGGAIDEAAKFDRNRTVTVKLGDGTPIEVKMSVDEESIHRTLEPFILSLEGKIKQAIQVLAEKARSETERDRSTVNAGQR